MKENHAFTLLELIVVIIIIGVLASLALPRFLYNIEANKGVEALVAMASLRRAVEWHYLQNNNTYSGVLFRSDINLNNLAIDDPANAPASKFNYSVNANNGGKGFFIKATNKINGECIVMSHNGGVSSACGEVSVTCNSQADEIRFCAGKLYGGIIPK